MRTFGYTRTTMLVALALSCGGQATAQVQPYGPPPPAPPTIWNRLGIPQTVNKMRDITTNRRGNRPEAERTDPLKRIADPVNLDSPNLAVKTAAKIKQDQDLAPQKIKAIKYLATVGCGCYPGVREALLDALTDCTEEVRYEAAIALCQAAGCSCNRCENGCCNAAVMNKLQDMAFGKDDRCCPKEASPRVRAAAENALNACKQKHPAGPVEAGKPGPGVIIEAPKSEPLNIERPMGSGPIPIVPTPAPVAPPKAKTPPPPPAGILPVNPLPVKPSASNKEVPAEPSSTSLPDMSDETRFSPRSADRVSMAIQPAGYVRPVSGEPRIARSPAEKVVLSLRVSESRSTPSRTISPAAVGQPAGDAP